MTSESLNLKRMHPNERRYVEEYLFASDDALCRGTWAMALMYGLSFDDEHATVGWRKFAGRPVGEVEKCVETCLGQPLELRWYTVSEFGRRVPAVERRVS